MKGLRLIDLESLLASVSRRASCNICGSLLTVREDQKLRKGICSRLSPSYTNSLCAGSDVAFCDPSKHSKAFNSRFLLAGRMCGRGHAGLSREVPHAYIWNIKFYHIFLLTCTYRHRKLKKVVSTKTDQERHGSTGTDHETSKIT